MNVDKHKLNQIVGEIRQKYQSQLKIIEEKYKLEYEKFNKDSVENQKNWQYEYDLIQKYTSKKENKLGKVCTIEP